MVTAEARQTQGAPEIASVLMAIQGSLFLVAGLGALPFGIVEPWMRLEGLATLLLSGFTFWLARGVRRHRRWQTAIVRNIQEPAGFVRSGIVKPPDRGAQPMRQAGQHDAFAQPPLVEDLAFLPLAGHDDDHGQGRAGQVPNVSFQPGQGFKGRAIVDHDDFGGLLVAGAAGPAGDVEDVADHVLRHRRGFVLPNRAQALEKVRDLSGRVRLRHPRPRLRAMPDPLSDHDRIPALLAQVGETVNRYFARLDELSVRSPESEAAAGRFIGALPEEGEGSAAALTRLLAEGVEAATRSAGPRFFHFVTGGSTPAGLAAGGVGSC